MVSLQAAISPEERKPSPGGADNPTSKKRKWQDGKSNGFSRESMLWRSDWPDKASDDVELHLDTPLPVEWQRCLDIKSGQIHFYNTRTQTRTPMDPRTSPEPPSSRPSLDLELNLTCEPPRGHAERAEQEAGGARCGSGGMSRSLSWVSLDADQQEMVAAVCMRCHMLVVMCKAAPSCPNCKLVHPPPEQSSSTLLKPGFRLLCCKD